jgi:adenylyl-sulfate kinase
MRPSGPGWCWGPADDSTSAGPAVSGLRPTGDVVWHAGHVDRSARLAVTATVGQVVWFTGLSGSGKSTVAAEVERSLVSAGRVAYLLDGDNIRHGLCNDLGFSAADRDENVRRVGEVAALFADAGVIALVPLVSPYRAARDRVRQRVESAGLAFVEVHLATPLDECERRDPKGLYARARAGEVKGMTGIDDPYEPPRHPELVLGPADGTPLQQAQRVIDLMSVDPTT